MALGKEFFLKKIQTLPSASQRALGKEFFQGHSANNFFLKKIKIFTECLQGWHSAKPPSTDLAP